MQVKTSSNLERIIAKIDNDFNPDNSDWIPRVGAWCIDAMSQLDVLRTKRKKKKLTVKDRIAYLSYCVDSSDIVVYDENGCKVKEAGSGQCCGGCPSTGEFTSGASDSDNVELSNTMNSVKQQANKAPDYLLAETINTKEWPGRYNVQQYKYGYGNQQDKNYVIADGNKIELNWDAKYICIETNEIETSYSNNYACELPVIPNNGILIEAIAYYCIYKMLCRGYKHPVFNLQASQYGTNPFYIWNQLKDEAKRSIINGNINEDSSKLFRSNLFIETFDTR